MSASETNTVKTKKRHRGPLIGIVAAVAFALILLALLGVFVLGSGGQPESDTVIDGRTGTVQPRN